MKKLLLYRIDDLKKQSLMPKIPEKFSHIFEILGTYTSLLDRTETIKFPINLENLFPIPKFRKMEKTYEELCNQRAIEILKKSEELNTKIYIMYSGGIDSTLILISFLKNSTVEQRKKMVVLLSPESVSENVKFYKNQIEGKLEVLSSDNLKYLFGTKNILVSGERNDLIFGGGILNTFVEYMTFPKLLEKYSRETMLTFFKYLHKNSELNIFTLDIFEKIAKKSPVLLNSNFDFLWWISFAMKWQHSYFHMLRIVSANRAKTVNKEYFEKYFENFFGTEEFQLWSMNNLGKRVKDTWESFKYICKDIIYDFTKDSEYRDNKLKVISLHKVYWHNQFFNFINSDLEFLNELDESYYNKGNDFE